MVENEQSVMTNTKEAPKKKSGWSKFFTFLAYGGWILVLILILAVVIAVSMLSN